MLHVLHLNTQSSYRLYIMSEIMWECGWIRCLDIAPNCTRIFTRNNSRCLIREHHRPLLCPLTNGSKVSEDHTVQSYSPMSLCFLGLVTSHPHHQPLPRAARARSPGIDCPYHYTTNWLYHEFRAVTIHNLPHTNTYPSSMISVMLQSSVAPKN